MGEETKASAGEAGRWSQGDSAPGGAAEIADPEDLVFDLTFTGMYHDAIQSWLELCHRLLMFLNILGGSAAIIGFGAEFPRAGQVAGLAVAVVSGIDIVWGPLVTARTHAALREKSWGLLGDLHEGASPKAIRAQFTRLHALEPPTNIRIAEKAHKRAVRSIYGNPTDASAKRRWWRFGKT